jgi:hypothetical protein
LTKRWNKFVLFFFFFSHSLRRIWTGLHCDLQFGGWSKLLCWPSLFLSLRSFPRRFQAVRWSPSLQAHSIAEGLIVFDFTVLE